MAFVQDSVNNFVKQNTYFTSHNNWENSSEEKMKQNGVQRAQDQQQNDDKVFLENRRKRDFNNSPLFSCPIRQSSLAPSNTTVDAQALSRELQEQMRSKEERISQLKEEEWEAEKLRRSAVEAQEQRERTEEQWKLQGREQYGRELREQAENARRQREDGKAREQAQEKQATVEHLAAMRVSDLTQKQEADLKKLEALEEMHRGQEQRQKQKEKARKEQWNPLTWEQPIDSRQEVAAAKTLLREQQLTFMEGQRANRQHQSDLENEEGRQRDVDSQEVDRVLDQRQGALRSAQRHLGNQVHDDRDQQVQAKGDFPVSVLAHARDQRDKADEAELSQLQVEQWKLEEEQMRQAARDQQVEYRRQLQEQIQAKANRPSNF